MALTTASEELFDSLSDNASNWGGTPLVEVSKEERGNLTQLKRAKLLETFVEEDGCVFAVFTKAGIELAAERGRDLSWITWLAEGVI